MKAANITRCFVVAILASLSYLSWLVIDTWRHIPEAYAAWDTGTLCVCYLDRNHGNWPKSWEDLQSIVKPDDECIFFRGVVGDGSDRSNRYQKTIEHMKSIVRIDWNYVPKPGVMGHPVTKIDGSPLYSLWADPNDMIFEFITNGEKNSDRPM